MDKLKMQTANKVDENVEKIAALFPNCVTENVDKDGKTIKAIDFDLLKQELSGFAVEGQDERYQFTWADKKKSILLANSPISKTLRPCREESVDFDTTKNLYIEGDNLDVLKLLQETYVGKVKMIYIDPPYNTGNDFVYEDDFAISAEEYLERSGASDDEGNRLFQNNDSNGRFHTDWLNMIYPRLKLARDLLTDDGVIFISIDDSEVDNLKKICSEIFGAENFVNIISIKMKNIAGASGGGEDKKLKKNIEYILVYAKNYYEMQQFRNAYVLTPIADLVEQYRKDGISWKYTTALVYAGEKEYVGSTTDGSGAEIKIYRRKNPITKSVNQIMKDESLSEREVYLKYGKTIFEAKDAQSSIRTRVIRARKDHEIADDILSIEYIPKSGKNKGQIYEQFYRGDKCRLFAWLRDVSEEKDGELYKKDLQGTFWDFVSETNNLTKEGGVPFPNGKKPVKLLQQMIEMQTDKEAVVLDFFSGSATTAHAVMQLNAEDGGNRKFIMVQLPEETPEDSEARKAGYKNICEIGKERIRRAGNKIIELYGSDKNLIVLDNDDKINLFKYIANDDHTSNPFEKALNVFGRKEEGRKNLDIGFRVLKLDTSNLKPVFYNPEAVNQGFLASLEDNIKEDRTPEDLLFQVMLDMGVDLSSPITVEALGGKKVFTVGTPDTDGLNASLICCFDKDITKDAVTAIAGRKPRYAVFRDSSFARDDVMVSFDQIFETYGPTTKRRVI